MAVPQKKSTLTKDALVQMALTRLGGRKAYYKKLSKQELEALLNSDSLVQDAFSKVVKLLMESAKTNLSANGRRLVAENKAGQFEGHYKEELQRRTYIEQQYYKVLQQLRQLLDVEESEILRAAKTATQLLKEMLGSSKP
ncbi:hypothetical protein IQ260_25225 [Leptolyngbya cf. ectocarpi LEGE 11479]|uniref:Uncharacterized protein n=1 Tax=Leptolyngbya cf. ectocarpi LEGE 11479 TaxID=1828722 RepID=A0A928ZYY5_LEPEC|nr:hypothetical protein [Leptolyngbya ectocarpi]MBE9069948.1 hypothetical protein [Leptolyngbya cf. ectocarpi LEGE 11479]